MRFVSEKWVLVLPVRRGNVPVRCGIFLALALLSVGCVPDRPAEDAHAHGLDEPVTLTRPSSASEAKATPEAGPTLDRGELIRAVLARNPTVEARRQAYRAASSRRNQVDRLDDPVVAYSIAPMSIGGGGTIGQTIQISQKFPWPGKLSNRGQSAEEAAEAARENVRVTELDLALEASLLYDDYYLADRSLEVNAEHRKLLNELRRSAEAEYSVGRGGLGDPLQAEVEATRLDEQDVILRSNRDVTVASLNALLHRPPDAKLPPPKRELLPTRDRPPSSRELTRRALDESPELRALKARERSAESRADAAERDYLPDFTLMASYNTMLMPDNRFMVGIAMPIPIHRGATGSEIDEASANAAEAKSEAVSVEDRLRAAVETQRRRVMESREVVAVYDGRLIPAARDQVAAATSDFTTGKAPFISVIEAEKNLRSAELARHVALAELSKRWARLDRALGRIPFGPELGGKR